MLTAGQYEEHGEGIMRQGIVDCPQFDTECEPTMAVRSGALTIQYTVKMHYGRAMDCEIVFTPEETEDILRLLSNPQMRT
jgi:hypothetical protein